MTRLHPADLEALAELIARQLAEQLRSEVASSGDLLTADQKARQLKVSRSHVYAMAQQLGAVRVGRAVRFPATSTLAQHDAAVPATQPQPRRPRPGRVELLPIREATR